MYITMRLSTVFAVLATPLIVVGCTTLSEKGAQSDPVSGHYAGKWWYGSDPSGQGGELTCEVVPTGKDTWHATFVAVWSETGTWEVPLEGRREDGRVLFGGTHDLGGDFGVYQWTGEVADGVFHGEYEGGRAKGAFSMDKTAPAS